MKKKEKKFQRFESNILWVTLYHNQDDTVL